MQNLLSFSHWFHVNFAKKCMVRESKLLLFPHCVKVTNITMRTTGTNVRIQTIGMALILHENLHGSRTMS